MAPRTKLCLCSDCSKYRHADPITNNLLPGLIQSADTVRRHMQRDDRIGVTTGVSPNLLLPAPPSTIPLHSLKLEASTKIPFEQAAGNAVLLATQTRLSFAHSTNLPAIPFIYDIFRSSFDSNNAFALENSATNLPFLSAENTLRELERQIGSGEGASSRQQVWDDSVKSIAEHAQQEWNRQHWYPTDGDIPKRAVLTGDLVYPGRSYRRSSDVQSLDRFFRAFRERPLSIDLQSLGLLLSHHIFKGSERLVRNSAISFRAALNAIPGQAALVTQLPLDPETMAKDFHLEPEYETYVMCSECCELYNPATAPEECESFYANPPNQCGAKLFQTINRKDGPKREPILQYTHQTLRSYLARMVTRADIEPCLQDYLKHQPPDPPIYDADMHDIWDSPKWWEFADGFMKPDGTETLKLLFGFGMDGFNPFSNKEAKQV